MTENILIPPAAELAGAQAYEDTYRTGASHRNSLRAAFEAMVAAWPGMEPHKVLSVRDNGEGYDLKTTAIILPLTENSNGK